MDPYAVTCREECRNIGFTGDRRRARPPLVEAEWVAVEVSEHVVLEHLLVTVRGELLATHGADFPVALHVLLKLVLIIVGREDDLAERTALHVHAANTAESTLHTRWRTLQQHTWLSLTWDQSRRQSDLRSQTRCGSLSPGAPCWDYPTT